MVGEIIAYNALAAGAIFVGQMLLNVVIDARTALVLYRVQKLVPSSSSGEEVSEKAAPVMDAFIRGNGILRVLLRMLILVALGFGAWWCGQRYGGWWWVFWLLFVYRLLCGIWTLPFDLMQIGNPNWLRQNPEAANELLRAITLERLTRLSSSASHSRDLTEPMHPALPVHRPTPRATPRRDTSCAQRLHDRR